MLTVKLEDHLISPGNPMQHSWEEATHPAVTKSPREDEAPNVTQQSHPTAGQLQVYSAANFLIAAFLAMVFSSTNTYFLLNCPNHD